MHKVNLEFFSIVFFNQIFLSYKAKARATDK